MAAESTLLFGLFCHRETGLYHRFYVVFKKLYEHFNFLLRSILFQHNQVTVMPVNDTIKAYVNLMSFY